MRVLIVDDSPVAAQLVRRLLDGGAGVEIVGEAGSGEEGIEACDALMPDTVVMDWSMPGMNGIEATAEICRRHPGIEVVGFTSTRDSNVHDAFRDAGATAVFAKDCVPQLRDYLLRAAAR